jgi:hypothetical protein
MIGSIEITDGTHGIPMKWEKGDGTMIELPNQNGEPE